MRRAGHQMVQPERSPSAVLSLPPSAELTALYALAPHEQLACAETFSFIAKWMGVQHQHQRGRPNKGAATGIRRLVPRTRRYGVGPGLIPLSSPK
eukprot:940703-Pleurochrysis_carterae.AAC.1